MTAHAPNSANPLARDLDHVLKHTPDVWEHLRDARIFITGGTGFFGCWLLETFLWANDRLGLGASVVALTRDPGAFDRKVPHLARHPGVTLHPGDIFNFEFPHGEFSYVIHAAQETALNATGRQSLDLFINNVGGTRRVLSFAGSSGVRRLLLTSSGTVYGKQPPDLTHVPEEYLGAPDPLDHNSGYAQSKRVAEHLALMFGETCGFSAVIARCFAFLGPYLRLDVNLAAGNFLRDALGGGPIHVNGDGTPYRSYLYAADLAAWLWTLLIHGGASRAYNVGSESPITIADLAAHMRDLVAPQADIAIARPSRPGAAAERYVPSTRRARNELGVDQHIDLEEAIRRTANWHQNRLHTASRGVGSI